MTLVNQLIKQANEGATILEVPENHVRSVAEHMRKLLVHWGKPTHEECEAALRADTATMARVPMKVVPKRQA